MDTLPPVVIVAQSYVDLPRSPDVVIHELHIEREAEEIKEAQEYTGSNVDVRLTNATYCKLSVAVKSCHGRPINIFHFSGHGKHKALVFESDSRDGTFEDVTIDKLREILPRDDDRISLVVLAACNSKDLGEQLIAERLAWRVIATRDAVIDDDVVFFVGDFYRGLFSGLKLNVAFSRATTSTSPFVLLPKVDERGHDVDVLRGQSTKGFVSTAIHYNIPPDPPGFLPMSRLPSSAQVNLTRNPMCRGVCLISEKPGTGSSCCALQLAKSVLRSDKFADVLWLACRTPDKEWTAHSRCPTPEQALASALAIERSDPARLAKIKGCLGRQRLLIVFDNVWGCECIVGGSQCTAGDYCCMRLLAQLYSVSNVKFIVTTSRPLEKDAYYHRRLYLGLHASYEVSAAVHTAAAAPIRPDNVQMEPHIVTALQSTTCSVLQHYLRKRFGNDACPTLEEWAWCLALQPSPPGNLSTHRMTPEAAEAIRRDLPKNRRPDLVGPSSMWCLLREEFMEKYCLTELSGLLRAVIEFGNWLKYHNRSICSATPAEIYAIFRAATESDSAADWPILVSNPSHDSSFSKPATVAAMPESKPLMRAQSSTHDPTPEVPTTALRRDFSMFPTANPGTAAVMTPPPASPTMYMHPPSLLAPPSLPEAAVLHATLNSDAAKAMLQPYCSLASLPNLGVFLFRPSQSRPTCICISNVQRNPATRMLVIAETLVERVPPMGYRMPTDRGDVWEFPSLLALLEDPRFQTTASLIIPPSPPHRPVFVRDFLAAFRAAATPSPLPFAGAPVDPRMAVMDGPMAAMMVPGAVYAQPMGHHQPVYSPVLPAPAGAGLPPHHSFPGAWRG